MSSYDLVVMDYGGFGLALEVQERGNSQAFFFFFFNFLFAYL